MANNRRELMEFFIGYGYEVSIYIEDRCEFDIYIHDAPKWYQISKVFYFKKMLKFLRQVTPVGLTFNIYKAVKA